jgi:single-strand DNA-binding protein
MASGDVPITIAGNLTADPELRYTPTGQAVANFTVAATPRYLDKASNEWKDGDSLFLRCNVWRQAAENVAESLHRGMRVIVTGRLHQRSYETREGEKRTVYEVEVDDVGPSMRNASAKVTKSNRAGGGGGSGGSTAAAAPVPADDPWASAPAVAPPASHRSETGASQHGTAAINDSEGNS